MLSEAFSKSGLDPASLKLIGIFQRFFLQRCNFISFNALISDLQQCVMNELLGSAGLSCIFHAYTARCDPTTRFKKKKKEITFCGYTITFPWQQDQTSHALATKTSNSSCIGIFLPPIGMEPSQEHEAKSVR